MTPCQETRVRSTVMTPSWSTPTTRTTTTVRCCSTNVYKRSCSILLTFFLHKSVTTFIAKRFVFCYAVSCLCFCSFRYVLLQKYVLCEFYEFLMLCIFLYIGVCNNYSTGNFCYYTMRRYFSILLCFSTNRS